MVATSLTKKVAYVVESVFGEGDSDMDANGTHIHCTAVDVAGLMQGVVPNANIRQRATANRAPVLGLKASSFSLSCYFAGQTSNASEDAQATDDHLSPLLKNCLGGQIQGFSAGLAGGSATAPEVETGHGSANFGDYWFGFFVDATTGAGEFRQIASWSTDTATMATGHQLTFTPDAGGADRIYAAEMTFIDSDAIVDKSDAEHTSLAFYFEGEPSDNRFYARGCRLALGVSGLVQGEMPVLNFSGQCATFENEGLSTELTGTPLGTTPHVVGSGSTTLFQLAAVGSNLANVESWGVEVEAGITVVPINGPNGLEGVHGFTAGGLDATMVSITVPWSDDWATAFRAGTRYHLLVQVGTQTTRAIGLYFPNLAFAENPQLGQSFDLSSTTIKFVALERELDVSAMSADDAELAQSKMVLLRVA